MFRTPPADRFAVLAAIVIAGLVAAYGIRCNFYVAGGTDSSGYVSAATRWQTGELYRPAPLHLWAAWPNAVASASPVAYRPALTAGTDIQIYPLGLPVVFAAAAIAGGSLAPFLVAPLFAALLTGCAFLLGRMAGGSVAGLVAATLVAVTPVTLLHTVDAMSDVPAAALWLLAWRLSLGATRGGAAAAGAAAAAAILIRPNLAPLAIVPGVLTLLGADSRLGQPRTWRIAHAGVFGLVAASGALVVAWSQAVLYGGPFTPGYVEWDTFFRRAHVMPNLALYPRLLTDLHTPLVLVGLIAPLWCRSRVTWSALAMLAGTVGIYLPYLSLDGWPFLRFLLPGLAALFVLTATVVAVAAEWLWRRARWLTPIALVPVALVIWQAAPERRHALNEWQPQTRVRLMGHYLDEVLPVNAAVLSFTHSGAVRHYTDRQVVRLDLLEPSTLDRVVDDLQRHGYVPVFVLDEALEGEAFRARFAASRYGRLDWPPRATFTAVTRIWYFVAADQARAAAGDRWVTDAVH